MKRVWICFSMVLLLILTILSCNSQPTEPYTPGTIAVSIVDNQFQPPQITVNKSDTVKWVNDGQSNHTSTSGTNGVPDGIWDSGVIHPGSNYSFVFDGVGTYEYYCSINWQSGMVGRITVVEP